MDWDFSALLAALTPAQIVQGIVAAGTLIAAVLFVNWAVNLLVDFFSGDFQRFDEDDIAYEPQDVIEGEEYECPHCGDELDSDDAIHDLESGYCHNCGGELG